MADTVNKAELERWAKRIREDLRDLRIAVQYGDLDHAIEMAQDAGGAAVQLETLLREAKGDYMD